LNTSTSLYYQLRNSSIISYLLTDYETANNSITNTQFQNKTNRIKTYSGTATKGAKYRMRKAVDTLLQISQPQKILNPITNKLFTHRLSFITLTISSNTKIDDKIAYLQLLRPFLQWLDKTEKVELYIWKAELQQRGQIHYHLTTPSFILHDKIRIKWNYLQRKIGLLKNNQHPPSTEIKEAKNIRNIEAYMVKEICKDTIETFLINEPNQNEKALCEDLVFGNIISGYPSQSFNDKTIYSKIWDCSENLKKNPYFTIEINQDNYNEIQQTKASTEYNKIIQTEHCTIIDLKENYKKEILKNNLKSQYETYINCIKTNKKYESKTQILKKEIKEQKAKEWDNYNAKYKEAINQHSRRQQDYQLEIL
jgi:hypothetical protein